MAKVINDKLSDRLSRTIIGAAGTNAALHANFPKEGANLVSLCVASWSVGIGHSVAFPDGNLIPAELYFMAEGRSGEGKSRMLNSLIKGLTDAISEEESKRKNRRAEILNAHAENTEGKKVISHIEQELVDKELSKNHPLTHKVSDATTAAMDDMLKEQKGWFVLKSSEQGLIDSLVLGQHSDGAANIDFMLNGFDGEETETRRIGRVGFSGRPHGGVGFFSQEGTIEKIMMASGNRGLTQRFFMMSEQTMMGSRHFSFRNQIPTEVLSFNKQCYSIAAKGIAQAQVLDFDNLSVITLSRESWDRIYDFKNSIEPSLGPGGKYEPAILSSMWSKLEMFVMKVAATIHIFSGESHLKPVDDSITFDAIMIVDCLLSGVSKIAEEKGIVGGNIEERSVLEYLEEKGRMKGLDMMRLKNSLSRRKIFEEYQSNRSKRVEEVVMALVSKAKVRVDNINGTDFYKFVKF